MLQHQFKAQLEQSQSKVRDLGAILNEEKASIDAACDKLLAKAKRGKASQDEIAYLGKRVEALHGYHRAIEAEKDRQIELLDKAERGELEKMHGLLSYAIASGQVSAEAQLLHGSLADFLSAKNDADRQAAKRSVHLCLEHGTLTKCDKKPDTAELDEFEFISDPEDASAYFRQHKDVINAQMDARRNSNIN